MIGLRDAGAKTQAGRIIWLKLGPRGGYKERPAVILTSDADLDPAEPFHVAVGSSQISSPLAPNEVLLPAGNKARHPLTKLKRPTVIVCDRIEEISYSNVLQ